MLFVLVLTAGCGGTVEPKQSGQSGSLTTPAIQSPIVGKWSNGSGTTAVYGPDGTLTFTTADGQTLNATYEVEGKTLTEHYPAMALSGGGEAPRNMTGEWEISGDTLTLSMKPVGSPDQGTSGATWTRVK